MAKDTNSFSNNLKKIETLRYLFRDICLYGSKSKKDYAEKSKKSERTVEIHIKKIKNYLDNHFKETKQEKKSKKTFGLNYNRIHDSANFLTKIYSYHSYTIEDLIFYFTFMQGFRDDSDDFLYNECLIKNSDNDKYSKKSGFLCEYDGFTINQLEDEIKNIYEINSKIINKENDCKLYKMINTDKIEQLYELGVLNRIEENETYDSDKKIYKYKFARDIFKEITEDEVCKKIFEDKELLMKHILEYVKFYYNQDKLSVPGYYLENTIKLYLKALHDHFNKEYSLKQPHDHFNKEYSLKQETPAFYYKNISIQNVINEDIVWEILESMSEHKALEMNYLRDENIYSYRVYPLKIVYESQYDRQYLCCYIYDFENNGDESIKNNNGFEMLRIDFIQNLSKYPPQNDKKSMLTRIKKSKIEDENFSNEEKFCFLKEYEKIDKNYENIDEYIDKLYKLKMKNVWNVSLYNKKIKSEKDMKVILHFNFEDIDEMEKNKILYHISKRKKHGKIKNKTDKGLDFEIDIIDIIEIKPWIRSFKNIVTVDKSNSLLYNYMKEDFEEILSYYK